MKTRLSNVRRACRRSRAALTLAVLVFPSLFALSAAAQSAPRVALVTRSVPVPAADEAYQEHLEEQGWDVTPVDDDDILNSGKAAISGYDLVLITSTVYWQRIKYRLYSAPEAIMVMKPELYPAFGMSGSGSGARGFTTSSKKVEIANPTYPMAAGLDGTVFVATRAKPMNYAKVGSGAYVIATARDAADQAVIFAYGAGDELANGRLASGPRIGFYMSQQHPGIANRDGWALFDAVAAWAAPSAPETTASLQQEPLASNNGILLGADIAKEGFSSAFVATANVENSIGRDLDIVNRNHEFSAGLTSDFFWDNKHVEAGRTVMVSWRATDNPNSNRGTIDPLRARKIVAGQFDDEIEAMAISMRDLEAPVMMMFNWEMDQDEGQPQYIGTAAEFVAAWRYVHGIFAERGATNVEWVWAPRARSFAKNDGQTFYPGSDYVDWVGGLAVPIDTFEDPETIYSAWYEWSANIGKPLMLWVGLRENPADRFWKSTFIDDIHSLVAGSWQSVQSIVYYSNISPLGYDYTVDTSTPALTAFRNLACNAQLMENGVCQ